MTVQAQSIDAPRTLGMTRRDLLTILLLVVLGAFFLILGAFSTEAGDQSVFTDEVLGTLLALPSQSMLYMIGAFCFFVAGMRLFRSLTSLWALFGWLVALISAFGFLVWVTSGSSMNRTWLCSGPSGRTSRSFDSR